MDTAKLSDFILENREAILDEWAQFAIQIPAGRAMDVESLRDHALGMLEAIAEDLGRGQTASQQARKSKGLGPMPKSETQAHLHGASRVKAGFSILDEVSEFRALRASVLRLWVEANPAASPGPSTEVIRFNEAIDQALTESVTRYCSEKERMSRLFDKLLSTSPDLSYIFDADGKLIYANAAFADLMGPPSGSLVGKHLADLGASFVTSLEPQLREALDSGKTCRGEVPVNPPGKSPATYEFLLIPVSDRSGKPEAVTGTARDVTERIRSEQESRRIANYDALTRLPNRNLFGERLDWEIRHYPRTRLPVALLFIDLDGFKQVNDRLGHPGGDLLLQQAAQRISSCLRETDTVARLGGDEFTVIVSGVKRRKAIETLAGKILGELAKPFAIHGNEAAISGSMGISIFPQDALTADVLVRNADQAMYTAKTSGGNRYAFFTSQLRDSASMRSKAIDELRQALHNHELLLHYQPIVDLASNRIVRAEALVRWQHPRAGLMQPGDFIGLAEEAGLIGEIDDWVLQQAAGCASEWGRVLGSPFKISVNRSASEFTGRKSPAPQCGDIAVEITEATLVHNSPHVATNLQALHEAGVEVGIDDFGTSVSSLVDLKKFEVNYLKIDPSLVHGLTSSADTQAIAEAMIVMAHRLGMKVVAEGVETPGQRQWLVDAHCDFAQGYLFSEPLPPQAFFELFSVQAAHGINTPGALASQP